MLRITSILLIVLLAGCASNSSSPKPDSQLPAMVYVTREGKMYTRPVSDAGSYLITKEDFPAFGKQLAGKPVNVIGESGAAYSMLLEARDELVAAGVTNVRLP